jgi:hypothetical protein
LGRAGAPARGRTWVPGLCNDGDREAVGLAAPGSVPTRAAAESGARAGSPTAQTTEHAMATRDENPMVI